MSAVVDRAVADRAVVDVSASGLVVATSSRATALTPAVAPASVVAARTGAALPAGGERMLCSPEVDALAQESPEECLADPIGEIDRARVEVAGMSVPTDEVIAAPVERGLDVLGARGSGTGGSDLSAVTVLVPGHWGRTRSTRLLRAVRRSDVRLDPVPAALYVVDAMLSSTTTWTTVIESMTACATVSFVRRSRSDVTIVDRRLVHRLDPVADRVVDDFVRRIVDAAAEVRAGDGGPGSGAHEVLVVGPDAPGIVDALDRRRVPSYLVPPTATAAAAVVAGGS